MFQELILHPFPYNLRKHISCDEIFVTFTLLSGIEVHWQYSSADICDFRNKLSDKMSHKLILNVKGILTSDWKLESLYHTTLFSRWWKILDFAFYRSKYYQTMEKLAASNNQCQSSWCRNDSVCIIDIQLKEWCIKWLSSFAVARQTKKWQWWIHFYTGEIY